MPSPASVSPQWRNRARQQLLAAVTGVDGLNRLSGEQPRIGPPAPGRRACWVSSAILAYFGSFFSTKYTETPFGVRLTSSEM